MYNVGSTSSTLVQHCTHFIQMFYAYWECTHNGVFECFFTQAIYARLHTTHTKSSAGETSCKEIRTPNPPGFGLKMYTNVEGIETRFLGGTADDGKVNEVIGRLTTAQTTSSQARRDPLRILLYPECTSLHNNVQRIRDYQQTGSVTKQTGMERRERWYN